MPADALCIKPVQWASCTPYGWNQHLFLGSFCAQTGRGGNKRNAAGRKGQGCLVALTRGKGRWGGGDTGVWKKTAAPPFFSSSPQSQYRSRKIHCLSSPYSTLAHTALIVQPLRALWVVLQWEVSGDVVSWFLTDSIHCSRRSSPSPGEPNGDQWGSEMNQSYSFEQVLVCTALSVMWPLQKHSETLPTVSVYNKGNIGFCVAVSTCSVGVIICSYKWRYFFLPLRQTAVFLGFSGLYMCVPLSICLTKLTSITSILCIPLQRHKARDADKHCANVWLVGPASPECRRGVWISCLKLAWWGSRFPHGFFWLGSG